MRTATTRRRRIGRCVGWVWATVISLQADRTRCMVRHEAGARAALAEAVASINRRVKVGGSSLRSGGSSRLQLPGDGGDDLPAVEPTTTWSPVHDGAPMRGACNGRGVGRIGPEPPRSYGGGATTPVADVPSWATRRM